MSDLAALDPNTSIEVQPREIVEEVFRALCVAGADPVEAQEAGRAVLYAEATGGTGLGCLGLLVGADGVWRTAHNASVETTCTDGCTVSLLSDDGQPALRTMLQLTDLASAHTETAASIAYTRARVGLPDALWQDVLLRRSASTGRRLRLIHAPGAGHPLQDGIAQRAWHLCGADGTAVIATTVRTDPGLPTSHSLHRPLFITAEA